jgi:hypothetical protein
MFIVLAAVAQHAKRHRVTQRMDGIKICNIQSFLGYSKLLSAEKLSL